MSRLWQLCCLISALLFIVQAQSEPELDDGVSIPKYDYTAPADEDIEAAGTEEEGTEDSNGEEDEEPTDEELKQVWEEELLSKEHMLGLHQKMDTDGNGKVSVQELEAFAKASHDSILKKEIAAVFDDIDGKVDGNKDGKISLEELLEANVPGLDPEHAEHESAEEKAEREKSRALEKEKFQHADLNKDKFLSREELTAVFYPEENQKILELVAGVSLKDKDKDGDGKLSFAELFPEDPDDMDESDIVQRKEREAVNKEEFEKLDIDKDGHINLKEFLQWESGAFHVERDMAQLMDVADENDDKHISRDELDKAREPISNSPAASHLMSWAEHYGFVSHSASETEDGEL